MRKLKRFKYTALDRHNNVIHGKTSAPSEMMCRRYLESKQLRNIKLKEYNSVLANLNEVEIGKKIKSNDIIFFLNQLHALLISGMRISESLLLIANQTSNKQFRKILYFVYQDVENGISLSKAMESHKEFPVMLVKMLSIGEQTGNIVEVLEETKEYFDKQRKMTKSLMKTIKMPTIYLTLAFVVTLSMLVFVFPVYSKAIANNSGKTNPLTMFFQSVSNFLTQNVISFTNPSGAGGFYFRIYGLFRIDFSTTNPIQIYWINFIIFLSLVASLIVGHFLLEENLTYRRVRSSMALRTPIIGKILKLKYISIISSSLAQLIKNKVDIIVALELTKEIVPNYVYKDILDEAIKDVASGESLAYAFENKKEVEEVVPRMITIGERSNNVEKMLINLSTYYNENIEDRFDSLREKIAPAIILFIYVLMGLLLIAMILPTFYAIEGF